MIDDAIFFIPADDRETWVMVGMSVKSELGEGGFELWNRWSSQASSYKAADAKTVWRSIKPDGGVTVRTLYKLARDNGYQGRPDPFATGGPPVVSQEQMNADRRAELIRRRDAADASAEMLKRAELRWHQYLVNKGFPKEQGFCLNGHLLIPMRDMKSGKINSLQTISVDGEKKFMYGGKAKGSVFIMGSGVRTYFVEGYATGLSVREALRALYSPARVVVCFSAGNLVTVTQRMGGDYVVADNDASGAGEAYAIKTGLPYWMPPGRTDEKTIDANDHHRRHGIRALATALNELKQRTI